MGLGKKNVLLFVNYYDYESIILKLYKTCSIIFINSNWPLRSTHPPHPPLKGHGKCKSNETCKCHIHFHLEINIVKNNFECKKGWRECKTRVWREFTARRVWWECKKGFQIIQSMIDTTFCFHIFLTAWGWAPSLPLTAAGL